MNAHTTARCLMPMRMTVTTLPHRPSTVYRHLLYNTMARLDLRNKLHQLHLFGGQRSAAAGLLKWCLPIAWCE